MDGDLSVEEYNTCVEYNMKAAKEIHELIIKDETLKKGEMVVVIEGSKEKQLISVEHEKVLFEEIQKLNGTKAASKIVSKISSKTSKEIYSIFSESKNDK